MFGSLPADLARAYARRPGFDTKWPPTHLAETSSTNDVALALAHGGAPLGTLVVADAQTAGRGRRGRPWSSPPGGGLYVSVVLPAFGRPHKPSSWLTLMAGVAAATAVRDVSGVPACLKWPNDLVVHDPSGPVSRWRKLGGILSEGVSEGARLSAVVVGIGINLRASAHAPDIASLSTSIEQEAGVPIDRGELLTTLLDELALGGEGLRSHREAEVRERFLAWSPLSRGGRVSWTDAGLEHEGTAEGLDDGGALLVRAGDRLARLLGGDVRWERHGTLD